MIWGWLFQELVDTQRVIYLTVGEQVKLFAADRNWLALLAVLPMGIVFGAVHALTPGHSKTVLATYIAGSPVKIARGLLVSLTLSFTHVTMSVLIAVFSLPLVSIALGSVGRAPALENVSRGLLGLIGLWMLWRAFANRHGHHRHEGEVVGFFAGLVPCPLTLFVMTFAITRGVPEAGLMFAVAMLGGVALTLSVVVVLVVLFRSRMTRHFETRPKLLEWISRGLEGAAGLVLFGIAIREILLR